MGVQRWLVRRAKCIKHKGRRAASIGTWGAMSLLMAAESIAPTSIGPWVIPIDLPLYFMAWPNMLRGTLWGLFGLVAITAALIRRDWLTTLAAMLLVVMPANVAAAFLLASAAAYAGSNPFALDALRAGLVWGGVAVQVIIVAGWSEVSLKLPRRTRRDRRSR